MQLEWKEGTLYNETCFQAVLGNYDGEGERHGAFFQITFHPEGHRLLGPWRLLVCLVGKTCPWPVRHFHSPANAKSEAKLIADAIEKFEQNRAPQAEGKFA